MTTHLRKLLAKLESPGGVWGIMVKMIESYPTILDRLDAAEAEVARLRGALEWIDGYCREEHDLDYNDSMRKAFMRNMGNAARAALKEVTK